MNTPESFAVVTTNLDIVAPTQAMDYLSAMDQSGLLYHLHDDPRDCLQAYGLTANQYAAIEHNVEQVLSVDWKGTRYECPFDYIIRALS